VFDYVDVHAENMGHSVQQLFMDGHLLDEAPCQEYSLSCYKKKMLQVFRYVSSHHGSRSFYVEGDNHVCVSLEELERMSFYWKRYFIGTGVGASGWLKSSEFIRDFISFYSAEKSECPDCMAANMMTKDHNPRWAVTRQYFVEHTRTDAPGLSGSITKHLPRCFEPHRGKWGGGARDKYGWDYFDYDECPAEDIFPCRLGPA